MKDVTKDVTFESIPDNPIEDWWAKVAYLNYEIDRAKRYSSFGMRKSKAVVLKVRLIRLLKEQPTNPPLTIDNPEAHQECQRAADGIKNLFEDRREDQKIDVRSTH